jgi:hypothetical protein
MESCTYRNKKDLMLVLPVYLVRTVHHLPYGQTKKWTAKWTVQILTLSPFLNETGSAAHYVGRV